MVGATLNTSIVINGFGRQRIYPPVDRCIYCFAADCDLGDEHIIPQALGGNIILRSASCRDCEKVIGGGFEQRLTHKTRGMFAAMRLRHAYKSKRPKDRPHSLPFTFITHYGFNKRIKVPARLVPRYWLTLVMSQSPGIILGISPKTPALSSAYWQYHEQDLKDLLKWYPGYKIKLEGAGEVRDLTRLIAKIAHAMAVAEYGLDAFEPWLPQFILGKDDCSLHYYVAGHENKTVESLGDHKISLGTWENDGLRIGATVRLFCRYGSPDYEVAVGKFKESRHERVTT
jgi:hypothetical protein